MNTKTIIYGFISIMCLIVFIWTLFDVEHDMAPVISGVLLSIFVYLTYNSFKKA